MATREGVVKRVNLTAFQNPRKLGIIAITLKSEEDELVSAAITDGKGAVVLSTSKGKAICFKELDVRPSGRSAGGVRGIRLSKGDRVVGMDVVNQDGEDVLMTVTESGYGKRTNASEYTVQGRGGQGLKTTTTGDGVVAVIKVIDNQKLMLITNTGRLILFKVSEVRLSHRNTHGVKLMDLEPEEVIVDVAPLAIEEDEDDEESPSQLN
ncbi:MAG: DNA gyrase subunit A, partial [Deltaproteobacteria bacterium]|jgi:DNA gyrase subunit A|nr:DNA gyrase subunit A [Deltaproteobacteria bacterium]